MTGKTGARPSNPAKPAGKAAPKPQRDPEPPAAPAEHRAGGWVDRGDGRGWELED